jgi:hypothetical protein
MKFRTASVGQKSSGVREASRWQNVVFSEFPYVIVEALDQRACKLVHWVDCRAETYAARCWRDRQSIGQRRGEPVRPALAS